MNMSKRTAYLLLNAAIQKRDNWQALLDSGNYEQRILNLQRFREWMEIVKELKAEVAR